MMKTRHFPIFTAEARTFVLRLFFNLLIGAVILTAIVALVGSDGQKEVEDVQADVQDAIPTEAVEAPGWRTK